MTQWLVRQGLARWHCVGVSMLLVVLTIAWPSPWTAWCGTFRRCSRTSGG
jgi:hypothetical protein